MTVKILIADDDGVSRAVLAKLVSKWGYQVVVAHDGEEATRILTEDRSIQLCILDWVMPKKTGPEVCREIRERGEEPYVYAILLTSRSETSDVVLGLQSGADDYVMKPCHPAELEFRIRAGLRVIDLQRHLIEAREKLRIEATHDALTGALNRRAVFECLQREVHRAGRRVESVSVVLLDIDHFKRVNDDFGHQAGDAVLTEMPRRISSVLREYDCVGRYGGEEFLVVLSSCGLEAAAQVAERIRSAIAKTPFSIPGGVLPITASLGVASTEQLAGTVVEGLVRAADAALYRAKRGGRNRVEVAQEEEFELPLSSKKAGSAA